MFPAQLRDFPQQFGGRADKPDQNLFSFFCHWAFPDGLSYPRITNEAVQANGMESPCKSEGEVVKAVAAAPLAPPSRMQDGAAHRPAVRGRRVAFRSSRSFPKGYDTAPQHVIQARAGGGSRRQDVPIWRFPAAFGPFFPRQTDGFIPPRGAFVAAKPGKMPRGGNAIGSLATDWYDFPPPGGTAPLASLLGPVPGMPGQPPRRGAMAAPKSTR